MVEVVVNIDVPAEVPQVMSRVFLETGDEAALRAKIFAAEDIIRQAPQQELKLVHYFAPGVYARELHVPAGVILTGALHKHAHFSVLSKGIASISLGDKIVRIEAPFAAVSPAGTKRIAYAHTDCVWTMVLGTEETDLDKIWDKFTARDEAEWLDFLCRP